MNLNSEQTLTEYAVARNEYKAATIEARAFVECSINRAPAGSWRGATMAVEKPLNDLWWCVALARAGQPEVGGLTIPE